MDEAIKEKMRIFRELKQSGESIVKKGNIGGYLSNYHNL